MIFTKISILGSVMWGGGLGLHAEYQLQVSPLDTTASWTVYRRYSAFYNLHKKLVAKVGGEEKALEMGLLLPQANYLGSRWSTFSDTISQRKVELQKYLDVVLTKEELAENEDLMSFLDCAGKGISGIILDVGADNVLKESFVEAKVIKSFPLGMWAWSFVALLRDGSFCVFQSKYDKRDQAWSVWKINSDDVRVVPKAKDNSVTLSSTKHDQKVRIRLQSPEEYAFWMRSLSEYSSSASYQSLTDKSREKVESVKQQKRSSKVSSPTNGSPMPEEHVHANGTGNTVDELSSMYGI